MFCGGTKHSLASSGSTETDKKSPATYYKKDISQAHDHLQWMDQTYQSFDNLGLALVGPKGSVTAKANPSSRMSLCTVSSLAALRDDCSL
jgi:hypothetical protein